MKKLIVLLISFVFFTGTGFSQGRSQKPGDPKQSSQGHCATDNLHISLTEQSPSYKRKLDEMNASYQKWATEKSTGNKVIGGGNNSTQTYTQTTLPVIFHMMTNSLTTSTNPAASATDANLTKAQIQTALGILNQLFAGTAVGSKTIAGMNTNIQFCLAEVDNFGNAITTYTYTNPTFSLTLDNTNQSQITALSNVVQSTGKFPPTKYINIYVVEDIAAPVAGFAYMPPAHGSGFDGIYIEAQYLLPPTSGPNDLTYNMTVLTHEMGHYLGMFHTFGICTNIFYACSCNNNNCLFDGDMVCDTPPDFSQSPTVGGCLTATNTCTTDVAAIGDLATMLTSDVPDLTNNYMDYGDWNCQYSFTQGQINRMHFMIDDQVGPRNSLLNSSVCNTLCTTSACTVSINSITTTSVNSVQLLNSLIGPVVNYTFSGTTCSAVYNAFNWSLVDLSNNNVIQTGTGSNFPTTFTATGNYRVILISSIAGSNPLCSQTASLNIQVLPPVNCPNNLDMTLGWNTGNWQRIDYEGGWSHTTNNSPTFTHPTTTLTILPGAAPNGTTPSDPFSFTTSIASDANFPGAGLPYPGATVMRVGRLITPTTVLPAGSANYVTYTFTPTNANAKIRVYYLGLKEKDLVSPVAYDATFGSNAGAKSGFGFVCNYNYSSVYTPTVSVTKGLTHSGYSAYQYFRLNDMVTNSVNSPTFAPLTIGTATFDAMTSWKYMDLDFSEFVCAAPTITITFFARSDEATTPGILHSYAYFATQCFPAMHKDIDLKLVNKDISCMADVGQSCTSMTLPPPNPYTLTQNGNTYSTLMEIKLQESNDGITYSSPVTAPYSLQFNSLTGQHDPVLNLCKTADAFPYKYFKITYNTLCQSITNTVSIFQGFVHTINDCAPDPMSGGHFTAAPIPIGSVTISPDQYQQRCGNATLTIGRPCWLAPTDPDPAYQWQIGAWSNISTATLAALTLSTPSYPCTQYRRLAKYDDPYCNTPTWIESDVFSVTDLRYNNFVYTPSGPDICGYSLATFSITGFRDAFDFLCDKELAAQTATAPVTNSVSFAFFSNPGCLPSTSLTANTGPSVLTFTYLNTLTFTNTLNFSYTFDNTGIYTANGFIYALVTVTRFGCTSTFTISNIPIKIKPSAIPGAIASASAICTSATYTITGDNPNSTGYYWEYSYSPTFVPTLTVSAATNSNLVVAPGTFTAYPVYVRRVANGTVVCPNVAYSNTLTINGASASLTISPSSSTICAGQSETLTATGATSYTWASPSSTSALNPYVTTPTVSTVYTVTGVTGGCTGTATVSIFVNPTPTLTAATSGTNICLGSCSTVTLSGGLSYTTTAPSFTSNANPVVLCPTVTTNYTMTTVNAFGCTHTRTISIFVLPAPTITATVSSYTICAGSTTTLTASGAGNYTWTAPPSFSATGSPLPVSPTVTTTYTVQGVNQFKCTDTETITITVLPSPTVAISGNTVICKGDCNSFTVTGGGTYSWSTGSTNSVLCLPTGVHSVTVTGINGCTSVKTVTVTTGTTPTITASAVLYTICAGSSTTLTASGGSSYTWTAGSFSSTSNPVVVSPTVTTTYTVTGTKAGPCPDTETITIVVKPKPSATILGAPVICSGCATLTASGGGTYTWSTGSTLTAICSNTPGAVSVTVTGVNGCTAVATVTTVIGTVPTLTISATSLSVCPGSTTALTASGATTYTWTGPGGYSTTTNPAVVSPSANTTYTVTGQVQGGCSSTKTITIYHKKPPPAAITGGTAACGPFTTTLTAGTGISYQWSTGAFGSTVSVSVSSPTTAITVTVWAVNGCSAVATTTLYSWPIPTPTITGNTSICAGSTATLTSSSAGLGGSYLWNTGSTAASITTSLGGVYTVTVTNLFGCKGSKSVTVTVLPLPNANITGSLQICPGQTTVLTATGGGTYLWHTGATTSTLLVNTTGVKTVTVTGVNGCKAVKSVTITVPINCPHLPDLPIGKIVSPASSSVYIYPNPTTQSFNVGNGSDVIMVEIFDYTGRLLKQVSKSENAAFNDIDIKQYVQGTYFIRIVTTDNTFSLFKLIKD